MKRRMTIIVMTTSMCNLCCRYCSVRASRRSEGQLDINDISTLIHNCSVGFDGIEFCWHGGEPLLVGKNFYQEVIMAQDLERKNRPIEYQNVLQSNGTLLDEDWLRFFRENKFGIGLSFDAPLDVHIAHRLSDPYKILNVWGKMKQMELAHGVICVVSKLNVNRGKEIFEFFKAMNVDSYSLLTLRTMPLESCPEEPSNEELFGLYQTTFELWAGTQNSIKSIDPIDTMVRALLGQRPLSCSFVASCPDRMITIDQKGNVVPCSSLVAEEFIVGNIFEEPLIRILARDSTQKYGDLRVQSINRHCLGCEFLSICRGGCRSDAYWYSGRYDGEYPYCEARKKTFKYLRERLGQILTQAKT